VPPQGEGPDFDGPFTHGAASPRPSPRPARAEPGPARRGVAFSYGILSSLLRHIDRRSEDSLHIFIGHPTSPLSMWD
jgi:hypothetical protein